MEAPFVSLRSARPEDADRIAAVHETSARAAYEHIFAGAFPAEEARAVWHDRLETGYGVVAEVSGVVVGFCFVAPEDELAALYVLPEWWGMGLGSRLLDAAPRASTLWVLEANESARAFYERHGWTPSGAQQEGPESAVEVQYVRRRPAAAGHDGGSV